MCRAEGEGASPALRSPPATAEGQEEEEAALPALTLGCGSSRHSASPAVPLLSIIAQTPAALQPHQPLLLYKITQGFLPVHNDKLFGAEGDVQVLPRQLNTPLLSTPA